MNLQQLRIIREAARCNYNLTEVANALFTSQSGVSRHIKELEDELKLELFIRQGKRLIDMTAPGVELVAISERILNEVSNIQKLSSTFANKNEGALTIATTHDLARYYLPKIITEFNKQYPKVQIIIHQSSSSGIAEMINTGEADIAIDNNNNAPNSIVRFPLFNWNYSIVANSTHPISLEKKVTLESLASYPLITYHQGLFPRKNIDNTFITKGIVPNIILHLEQPDIIQTYVQQGLGIGILIDKMIDPNINDNLSIIDASHLFTSQISWIGLARYKLQKNYIWHFIQLCNSNLSLADIKKQILNDVDEGIIDYQI